MEHLPEIRHFKVEEFVSSHVYWTFGPRSIIVMDWRIIKTVVSLREVFDRPVTINDWVFGGNREYSGFREPNCSIGVTFSQHRFGRAIDCLIKNTLADEVRRYVVNHRRHFPYVTAMEDGVPWVHLDCRTTEGDDIFIFGKRG